MLVEALAQEMVGASVPDAEVMPTRAYIRIRAYRRMRDDLTLVDPANADAIVDSRVPALRAELEAELAQVRTAVSAVLARVRSDATSPGRLIEIDLVPRAVRSMYTSLLGGPSDPAIRLYREGMVRSIAFRLCAETLGLAAPTSIEALYFRVERNQRMVERMLYQVGRVEDIRRWGPLTAAGSWDDGLNRIFEYPRLGGTEFHSLCDPDPSNGDCRAGGMDDWWYSSSLGQTRTAVDVCPPAQPYWTREPPLPTADPLGFFYLDPGRPSPDPVLAVDRMFTSSNDYRQRNLINCDHVIHALHVEALIAARRNRSAPATWLQTIVSTEHQYWLRIGAANPGVDFGPTAPRYLVAKNEPRFFTHVRVHLRELIPGDHLIIWNHPAYTHAFPSGIWRLENAVVVATDEYALAGDRSVRPPLGAVRLQGHGTEAKNIDEMRSAMVRLFNRELGPLQDFVRANWNGPLGAGGALESERTRIVRRDDLLSLFHADVQYGAWWVRWTGGPDSMEVQILNNPTWRAAVLREQLVDIQPEPGDPGPSYTQAVAWFPLWVPQRRRGSSSTPYRRLQPVRVEPRMTAAWSLYSPEDVADRDFVWVIRPNADGAT